MSLVRVNILYFIFFFLTTLGIFTLLFYFLGKYYYLWIFFFLGHYLITLVMITYFQLTNSWFLDYKLFWCWLLVLFPYFGLFCFFLYGKGYKLHRPLHLWLKKIKILTFKKVFGYNQEFLQNDNFPAFPHKTFTFLNKLSSHPIYHNVKINPIYSTYHKFKCLQKNIGAAKKYVLINYFLFNEGKSLEWLTTLLLQKLKEKVKVYVIFDFFGRDFFNSHLQKLIKAGIRIANKGKKIQPDNRLFYVNHRKIIVIDGEIAYIGGFNVNDSNANLTNFGFWLDLHMEIVGKAVKSIENIFLKDWLFWTNEILSLSPDIDLKAVFLPEKKIKNVCQFLDENPRVKTSITKDTFFHLFNNAQKSIYITTPYFFIDDEIRKSLINAALSGIKVVIFLPQLSTPIFSVDFNRLSYDPLIKAGVKIYEFIDAFIHSKLIIIDDKLFSVGSSNLDYRSFYFASEITAIIYDPELAQNLKKQVFLANFPHFQLIETNPLWKKNKIFIWFLKFCQIAKIFY